MKCSLLLHNKVIGILIIAMVITPCLYAQENETPLRYTFGFEAMYDTDARGFRITKVNQHSPAAMAGVEVGDYIVAIDYSPNVIQYLYYATRKAPNAQRRTFTLIRDGTEVELIMTPETVPSS